MNREGFVYYIACTETKRIKIGFTQGKVEKRLAALQTGSPTKLTVVAVHPGSDDDERRFHNRHSSKRLHGEWFEMDEELFIHICAATCYAAGQALGDDRPIDKYTALGLEMVKRHLGELPFELEELIGWETLQ